MGGGVAEILQSLVPLMNELGVGVAVVVSLAFLFRYLPQLVLGPDSIWMLKTLASYLPVRANPLLWLVRQH